MTAGARAAAAALLLVVAPWVSRPTVADAASASDALARDMLEQLVAINTTDSVRGNVTAAAADWKIASTTVK